MLIVVDTETDSLLLLRNLRRSGFEPTARRVQTLQDLRAALAVQRWDVVVCDQALSGVSVQEALDCVHRYDPEILRIVAASSVDRADIANLARNGANDVVDKSDLTELGPAITRGLVGIRRLGGAARGDGEAVASERSGRAFMAVVVHELRTPLTAIKGSLGLLRSEVTGPLSEKAAAMVQVAHANTERLARLVNDILDIEKIESGAMSFAMQPVELLPFLEQVREGLQGYLDQCRVTLELDTPADLGTVTADPDRLVQVLNNLISNAAKFSPEGETVTLGAVRRGSRVRFTVTDRGPGIAEEYRAQIFDKFTPAATRDPRRLGSTGLGLSISRAIVERLGGRLGFVTRLGKGTSFYFELGATRVRAGTRHAAELGPRPRILVLDDDRNVRRRIKRLLAEQGFDVTTCATAATAKKRMTATDFAAITVDIALPDGSAVALIGELRGVPQTQALPIIAIVAEPRSGRAELSGRAVDIVDWIDNPLNLKRLRSGVERVARELAGQRLRILHVGDDGKQITIVARTLKDLGSVDRARTAQEASRALQRSAYDLMILDPLLLAGGDLFLPPARSGETAPRLLISPVRPVPQSHLTRMAEALAAERTGGAVLLSQIHGLLNARRTEHDLKLYA